jgi:stage V sporulation protein B
MADDNYLKKIVGGSYFVFIFSVLGVVLSYLLRFVLTANLTPQEYGLFYALYSLIGLLALFNFGLPASLVYHISKFKVEKKFEELRSTIFTVLIIQLFLILIAASAIFLFSEIIVINYLHLYENVVRGAIILKFLAIVYFIQVFYTTVSSTLRGFQKMKLYALTDFTRLFLWFISTYALISFDFSALSPAIGLLISYIFVSIIFWPFVLKLIPKVKLNFSKKLAKKLVIYGFPIMLSGAAGLIIGYTDTILITFFRSLEEVGIYQTAQPTARLLWFFAGSLITVLFPLVAELKTKKDKRLEKGISLIYRYIWIVLVPFALMAFSFSKEILNLFFGSFYAQGSPVLKILTVGAVFFSITQINGVVLNGLGKPKNFTKVVYTGALVNLVGNLSLIPIIGIIGAAISTLLTYLVMLLFSFTEVKKFIKVKIPFTDWIKTLVVGFVSLLSIYLLKNLLVTNVFLEVFICFSVSISVFFGLLIILKVINLNELLGLIKQIVKK